MEHLIVIAVVVVVGKVKRNECLPGRVQLIKTTMTAATTSGRSTRCVALNAAVAIGIPSSIRHNCQWKLPMPIDSSSELLLLLLLYPDDK